MVICWKLCKPKRSRRGASATIRPVVLMMAGEKGKEHD